MEVSSTFTWEPGAKNKLETTPDKVTYTMARMTLDMTEPHIPLSNNKNAGKLRQTSMSAGVRGSNKTYYIGSYTNYAKYVWNMGDSTHWTTPQTFGKWYQKIYTENSKKIMDEAIGRNELK